MTTRNFEPFDRDSDNINCETQLVPPGQFVTQKFPALTWGPIPKIDLKEWRFEVFGLVEKEVSLQLKELQSMNMATVKAGFHCVTGWSRLANLWTGVLFTDIAKLIKPLPQANYVYIRCYGGYTTNVSVRTLINPDVILACFLDKAPLDWAHGKPLRLVIPGRYGWKSAKWVRSMEFIDQDRPGFWEQRGYHPRGNPWAGERTTF